MNYPDEKIIELSKAKLFLILAGAMVFVALGISLLQMGSMQMESHQRHGSPMVMHCIGLVTILFFGACGLFSFRKLFDRKPGLVLNSAGILDNSSGVAAGLIPWSEITGFGIYEVKKQKTLVVKVKNPEKYIERGSGMKRTLNRMNYTLCGSPIAITSNSLKIGFNDLLEACNTYWSKYGKAA